MDNNTITSLESIYVPPAGGTATWGAVIGDLTAQTDLNDRLVSSESKITIMQTNSADWDTAYTLVQSGSGTWGGSSDLGDIPTLSGNWNSVYTTVQTNSGSWGGGGSTPVITTLTYSASVTTDLSTGDIFIITLTGNMLLDNPTNPVNGKGYTWYIVQDSVGSKAITLGSKFKIPSSATTPLAWSTAASAMDLFAVRANTDTDKYYVVSMIPGYTL